MRGKDPFGRKTTKDTSTNVFKMVSRRWDNLGIVTSNSDVIGEYIYHWCERDIDQTTGQDLATPRNSNISLLTEGLDNLTIGYDVQGSSSSSAAHTSSRSKNKGKSKYSDGGDNGDGKFNPTSVILT